MDKASVAQRLQFIIANLIASLGAFAADKGPQAVLHIAVEDSKAFRSIDDREKPVAPSQFVIRSALQQLTVKNTDKGAHGFIPPFGSGAGSRFSASPARFSGRRSGRFRGAVADL